MSLSSVRSELNSIINELASIQSGLKSEFSGIGSEVAAARIQEFIDDCERAKNALGRVDPSNLSEAHLESKGR
jgi:hypothetical protein